MRNTNPATGTWTVTGNMSFNRYDAFGLLLSNCEALVLDGTATSDIAWAELYNSSTGTWTLDAGNGIPGNTGPTVTLLATGMVLTAGGTQGVLSKEDNDSDGLRSVRPIHRP